MYVLGAVIIFDHSFNLHIRVIYDLHTVIKELEYSGLDDVFTSTSEP